MLAQDIDDAITELLAGTYRVKSTGSLLRRAHATVPEPAHALHSESYNDAAEHPPAPASAPEEDWQVNLELQNLASRERLPSWRQSLADEHPDEQS
jgi:hypothetical protein